MKTKSRLLCLLYFLSLPLTGLAGGVDTYWPLNPGDYRVFTYGANQLTMSVGTSGWDEYMLSYSTPEDSGYELHQKTPAGVYLTKVSANGGWIKIYFDPDVFLFDDALLENGGSRTTSTSVSQSGAHYSATFTVKVAKAGTVTVPAGKFFDCRSVTVTEKATVPGQGTMTASALTAILAPKAGMIKKLVKPGVWSVLTSGTVGGQDVTKLGGTGPVTVQITGGGSLSPSYTGQTMNFGQSYTVTAVPASGYIFSHWSGSASGTSPKLTFVMQENFVLEAVFVPNPFTPVKGSYNGLVSEPAGVMQRSAGSFTCTITDKGSYSGSITLAGKKYTISGQFDADGNATGAVKLNKTNSLPVSLVLDLAAPNNRITGTLGSAEWTAQLEGERTTFDGRTNMAPWAGKYTLIIPGSDDAVSAPGGDSCGTLSISTAGKMQLAASLADGTKISQGATLSTSGRWPLYIPLNKGTGLLQAWVQLASSPTEDLRGDGVWIKPASSTKYYPAGFARDIEISGCTYTPPAKGVSPLGLSEAKALLQGGNLAADIEKMLVFNPGGKVTNLTSREFTLSCTGSTGNSSGKAGISGTTKSVSFNGVVLQKLNTIRGYFLGTNQSGLLWIGPGGGE